MSTIPPLSVGGLGNGIDYGQLLAQLVQLRQVPITRLQTKQQALQTLQSDYTTLSAKLTTVQRLAQSLATPTSFTQNTASVSDPTVVVASASASAVPGSTMLQVQQLATAQVITNTAATAVASPTTSLTTTGATFEFQVGGGAPQTITLAAGATLTDLATSINALTAGVTASIVNTGTATNPAYRLVLTATNTGASNAITITNDTTSLDFLNQTGSGGTVTLQAAQDAVILLGNPAQSPLTIQRASNTITDALPGVTLSLKAVSTAPVTLTVTRDVSAITTPIASLVSAYNDLVTYLNQNATYNPTTHQGGPFFSEQAARTTIQQLRRALLDSVPGEGPFTGVGAIGLSVQRDGTLSLDQSQLNAAVNANAAAVQALFVGSPSTPGVGQRLVNAVNALQDPASGALPARQQSLTEQLAKLSDAIQQQQDQVSQYQASLQQQFAQLDAVLRTLNSQMQALTLWTQLR